MRVHTDLTSLPPFKNAVVTIGSFDGVHLGHQRILEDLKRLAVNAGGETVVITFDPHPRSVLKPDDGNFRLITTTAEKTEQLAAAGIDHLVIVPFDKSFASLSADEYITNFLISKINPGYVVIGYDHRFGASREGNIDLLRKYASQRSFEVVEISAEQIDEVTVSSSKIRKALDASDIELANKLLGRPFSFSGSVIHGDHIGRTISFPTANIRLEDPNKLVLPHGIYGAIVIMPDGSRKTGALYIGDRPSVATGGSRVIEVHIPGFGGDLYGQYLKVEVLGFVRPDMKFDSMDADSTATDSTATDSTATDSTAATLAAQLAALPGAVAAPVDAAAVLPSRDGVTAAAAVAGLSNVGGTGSGGGGQLLRGGATTTAGPRGLGKATQTYVFGVPGVGSKFLYLFDRSASMSGFEGRPLAAAKRELANSLRSLESTHQFQIIFYNNRPSVFNPFAPQPPRMVFGEDKNKRLAEEYIRNMTADGGTDHMLAINLALGLAPDVVFFLTDADDPQLTAAELAQIERRNRGIVFNTIEFGAGPQRSGNNFLVRLARQNGGQHAYVDVTRLPP